MNWRGNWRRRGVKREARVKVKFMVMVIFLACKYFGRLWRVHAVVVGSMKHEACSMR